MDVLASEKAASVETTGRPAVRAFLRSFGPAWIVMIADVDAASILTAAENGASYGYGMIWVLLLLTIPLFVIQEAAGRVGVATGRGLGEVVRDNYSRRTAVLMSLPMALTDFLSYVAEYTGIAVGMALLGVPPFISLPVAYVASLLLVYKRTYVTVEKGLLIVSGVFIVAYLGSLVTRGILPMSPFYVSAEPKFLYLLAADVGAVVMPFMLFYQASATAEKGGRSVRSSRRETLVGALVSEGVMVAIVMASAGLDQSVDLARPDMLSSALASIAGGYAPLLFGIGLVCAAFLALVVISFAGAWGVAEAMGWGRQKYFPIYVAESAPAVLVPLLFASSAGFLLQLMVVFVFVLIGPGVIMGLLASNRRIMGAHASVGVWRWAYWACLAAVVASGVVAVAANL